MAYISRLFLAAAVCSSAAAPAALAIAPPPPATLPMAEKIGDNPDPARYMFENELSPGMKGYGLTVMHGDAIEKFNVEIIDVVRNFSPGNNAILVRCSGLGLEHSGIIAGMSGSPVFIDNRMIGAVAFGWGMSKDPIGGVQPIRQMLAIHASPAPPPQTAAMSGGERWSANGYFARQAAALPGWKSLTHSLRRHAGKRAVPLNANLPTGMTPLLSPLMVSGASPATVASLRDALAGTTLYPLASGSAGSTPTLAGPARELGGLGDIKPGDIRLQPGSAIAIPLVTGDMDLSAIGTVTEVRDGKVYAFGHAFLGDGATQLPIATSYIYTVLPNVNISFKMGTSIASTGSLVTDEETGIVGIQGKIPPTVPITFVVKHADGSVNNTFHYQLAPHPRMTPELLTAIIGESLISHRSLPPEFTARITGSICFAATASDPGATPPADPLTIHIDSLGATQSFNPNVALLPIAILGDNPFQDLKLKSVSLEATIDDANRGADIRSVQLNRLTVAPGDDLRAVVQLAPFHAPPVGVPISLHVPDDAQDGEYQLSVGSAAMALQQEAQYAPQRFDPGNVDALSQAVQHILNYTPGHLYATLVMNVSGAAVHGHEHANLPASRIALYASDRRNDTSPVFEVATADVDANAVIADGGQTFTVVVDRNADRRYFEPKSPGNVSARNDSSRASPMPMTAPASPLADDDPNN